jgi:hypothetical protein
VYGEIEKIKSPTFIRWRVGMLHRVGPSFPSGAGCAREVVGEVASAVCGELGCRKR